jgi:hypothetical protein
VRRRDNGVALRDRRDACPTVTGLEADVTGGDEEDRAGGTTQQAGLGRDTVCGQDYRTGLVIVARVLQACSELGVVLRHRPCAHQHRVGLVA